MPQVRRQNNLSPKRVCIAFGHCYHQFHRARKIKTSAPEHLTKAPSSYSGYQFHVLWMQHYLLQIRRTITISALIGLSQL
jgi:hypothetical protein